MAGSVILILIGALTFEIIWTQPVRGAMQTFAELLTVGNGGGQLGKRSGNVRPSEHGAAARIEAAKALCSSRYLQTHTLALAHAGGIVGIPRNINKNFQAWREGPNVWVCPTNRIGPVYQFVFEEGRWRFDGLVGILRARGELIRMSELPEAEQSGQ
jgi:hypothetical protein